MRYDAGETHIHFFRSGNEFGLHSKIARKENGVFIIDAVVGFGRKIVKVKTAALETLGELFTIVWRKMRGVYKFKHFKYEAYRK